MHHSDMFAFSLHWEPEDKFLHTLCREARSSCTAVSPIPTSALRASLHGELSLINCFQLISWVDALISEQMFLIRILHSSFCTGIETGYSYVIDVQSHARQWLQMVWACGEIRAGCSGQRGGVWGWAASAASHSPHSHIIYEISWTWRQGSSQGPGSARFNAISLPSPMLSFATLLWMPLALTLSSTCISDCGYLPGWGVLLLCSHTQ